ncbi:MAG: hypothetical protein LBV15_02755 [Planctomycetota bacterium]|nr:hypothetical protein [Planctomycetota bacterium]
MTRNDAARLPAALFLSLILSFASRGGAAESFSRTDGGEESLRIARSSDFGQVLAVFSTLPLARGTPPDGVSRAALRALGRRDCSAAFFHWQRRDLAEDWIREQLERRRRAGRPARLILAGHGHGGAAAADAAHAILSRDADAAIILLLTVDAVKTDRLAAAAGSAIVNRIPGVSANFMAYDSAPVPDGIRLWSHVNYYQDGSEPTRGTAMPGAENHLARDPSGLLNHGNIDDFMFPLLVADFRAALERRVP